ncbi:MAG: hypothetical protein ACREM2_06895 [Vulcanimicrobiaceae bacterium]
MDEVKSKGTKGSAAPITPPQGVDADWLAKIERAREAQRAGAKAHSDQCDAADRPALRVATDD